MRKSSVYTSTVASEVLFIFAAKTSENFCIMNGAGESPQINLVQEYN
jgi:hypothetical protein